MSLKKNTALYEGCEIEEVAGRLNLKTPVDQATNIVGRNIAKLIEFQEERDTVTLTGPMAVWAYLICFHAVLHVFKEVRYNDGKNDVVVARHG